MNLSLYIIFIYYFILVAKISCLHCTRVLVLRSKYKTLFFRYNFRWIAGSCSFASFENYILVHFVINSCWFRKIILLVWHTRQRSNFYPHIYNVKVSCRHHKQDKLFALLSKIFELQRKIIIFGTGGSCAIKKKGKVTFTS